MFSQFILYFKIFLGKAGQRSLRLKPNSIPSINLPGEDYKQLLLRREVKEKRNERMKVKDNLSSIHLTLNETLQDDVNSAENTDWNPVDPSYQNLLDTIETQTQELMILKDTIRDLQQQLDSSKPQV